MRLNGTQYDPIDTLPKGAKPVSTFAKEVGTAVGYVYIKHQRHFKPEEGKKAAPYPGYVIKCFEGTNYVIPDL